MKLEEILGHIPSRWQGEFVEFVQSGEASDRFLAFLDSSDEAQAAVEQAFTAQASTLEGFAKKLQQLEPLQVGTAAAAEYASGRLARSVRQAAELPREEREIVTAQAADRLRRVMPADLHGSAAAMVSELGRALGE
jgi:hypothetical protein